ncbi:GSCOCT00014267001.2-RA-CDS [Cotesia congregata]|uniref:Cc_p94.1_7.1b n=1 Tax=Cotesia congregata TaxID=51543 RepID=S6D310_COTCN|nr:GSCOCT00014267001.2-RA-CDS [Cotesia congregata]CAG5092602.1 cc_p94.1_7.1b [Cotesia congregata]CCQ71306.1 hypothetical protein P94-like1 [Cotesia congregata]
MLSFLIRLKLHNNNLQIYKNILHSEILGRILQKYILIKFWCHLSRLILFEAQNNNRQYFEKNILRIKIFITIHSSNFLEPQSLTIGLTNANSRIVEVSVSDELMSLFIINYRKFTRIWLLLSCMTVDLTLNKRNSLHQNLYGISTTLPTALWYCVELSSGIFKNDPQHYKQERLRGYYSVARYMIEILTWFNYDLDLKPIEKRKELLSYVMTLKKIQKRRKKIYYLLEKIFKTVDGFLVSEIEKSSNLYKLNYLKLNHKGILRDDILEEKVHLNDFVHLMHFEGDLEASEAGTGTFDICEKTFRPYFAIDQDKSFYTELVKNTKKVVISNDDDKDKIKVTFEPINSLEFDRVLSLYKLFIDCVKESKKYPTLPKYVDNISKRKKFHMDLVTLFPSNVYFDIKDVYERYQKVVKKVRVNEFLKVYESHVGRMERIKAEKRVKFSSDSEISKFITSEELKVKLNSNHTRKKK